MREPMILVDPVEACVAGIVIVGWPEEDFSWLSLFAAEPSMPRFRVVEILEERRYPAVAEHLRNLRVVTVAKVTFPVRHDDGLLWLDRAPPAGRRFSLVEVADSVEAQGYGEAARAIRASGGLKSVVLS